MFTLNVASDFTRTPGVRSSREGEFSGEDFLVKYLSPLFLEAVAKQQKLLINLDGTAGYATSFLEAAFGGLVRGYEEHNIVPTPLVEVKRYLELKSTDDPYLIEEIEEYMHDADMFIMA